MPTIARPSLAAFTVVRVSFSVPAGSLPAFSAAAAAFAGTIVKTTFSPGVCFTTSLPTSPGSFTAVPSTARITSPACSRFSEGVPLMTAETTTLDFTGMFSCRSAATLALSCDWVNSSAFSCVDCSSVLPSG